MKPPFQLLRLPILFIAVVSCIQFSEAATKYVSNTGNNSNSGNSWAQAWLTLQYAANNISAGDTVWVADGTYTGFDLRTSGTNTNPIVFIAANDNAVINLPC